MNTPTPFTVTIVIDKTAALLAGVDEYGSKTIEVSPSTLTATQRQTLVRLDFHINSSKIGRPIDGTESIESLLDLAALELEAEHRKLETENAECITRMIAKIIEAPLSDHLSVDARTGCINVVKLPGALVSIGSNEIIRYWAVTWCGLWEYHAAGTGVRRQAIRQAVLECPEVAEKIRQAEQQADTLNECLVSAKSIRDRLAAERMAEKNRLEQEAAERRKDQLDKFVADHMNEAQQRRYAAGLMAESEIIDAIEAKTFAHLAPYVEYSRIRDQDVTEHVLNALGLDVDYLEYDVSYGKRALQSATDDEFNRMEHFKRLLPAASVKLFQRFGYLDQYTGDTDPYLIVNTCEITVQVGEFAVRREYLL